MNTCAECRFWEDSDLVERFGEPPCSNKLGEWKECTRVYEPDSRASVAAMYSQDDALMTRSDFGCVQFEKAEPNVIDDVALTKRYGFDPNKVILD